ncbi:MAG TPA: gamma-glutamylcyclotransferase, partial [Chloroflexota bacterium]
MLARLMVHIPGVVHSGVPHQHAQDADRIAGGGAAVSVDLFVNGTLMRGLELHPNLAGAEFLEACSTAPRYRIFSIGDIHPGMFEVGPGEQGIAVPGELYRVPDDVLQRVEAGEPPHLYRGPVHLSDGRIVDGI